MGQLACRLRMGEGSGGVQKACRVYSECFLLEFGAGWPHPTSPHMLDSIYVLSEQRICGWLNAVDAPPCDDSDLIVVSETFPEIPKVSHLDY